MGQQQMWRSTWVGCGVVGPCLITIIVGKGTATNATAALLMVGGMVEDSQRHFGNSQITASPKMQKNEKHLTNMRLARSSNWLLGIKIKNLVR